MIKIVHVMFQYSLVGMKKWLQRNQIRRNSMNSKIISSELNLNSISEFKEVDLNWNEI